MYVHMHTQNYTHTHTPFFDVQEGVEFDQKVIYTYIHTRTYTYIYTQKYKYTHHFSMFKKGLNLIKMMSRLSTHTYIQKNTHTYINKHTYTPFLDVQEGVEFDQKVVTSINSDRGEKHEFLQIGHLAGRELC